MNHYADYIKEREGFELLQHPHGFAIYKIEGEEIYLKDIYVTPQERGRHVATELADAVSEIGMGAGCIKLLGSVSMKDKNLTRNLQILLAYGFKCNCALGELLLFSKEL
jgi:hypothetical protein